MPHNSRPVDLRSTFFQKIITLRLALGLAMLLGLNSCSVSNKPGEGGQAPPVKSVGSSSRANLRTKTIPCQLSGANFDWDDNIMFMPTQIYLFHQKTRKQKTVSTDEFAKIRFLVGKTGVWRQYQIREGSSGSFREFRDIPGKNQFLSDIRRVVESSKGSKKPPWKGPSWSAFVQALSSPQSAWWTSVITARAHSSETLKEGVDHIKSLGLTKFAPRTENLVAVSNPDFSNPAETSSEAKVRQMKRILDDMESRAMTSGAVEVVDRDGGGRGIFHLWGFSDDDYGNYESAYKGLSKDVASGRWNHVKITLFYTRKDDRLHSAQTVVIRPDGSLRPRLESEIGEELAVQKCWDQIGNSDAFH